MAGQYRLEVSRDRALLNFEPDCEPKELSLLLEAAGHGSPSSINEVRRILEVDSDRFFAFDKHYSRLIAKANLRKGTFRRVANSSWVLERGVLKMTHDAIIDPPVELPDDRTGGEFAG